MCMITLGAFAQTTYTSSQNGYWHNAATWGGSGVPGSASDITIAAQSFESAGSDNWSYTATSNVTESGNDTWGIVTSLGTLSTMATNGSSFWGALDVNNDTNPLDTYALMTMSSVTVSGYTNVQLKFDYEADGYDTGDDIDYVVTIDGTAQSSVKLVDGASNLNQDGTVTINIPDGSTTVSIEITVTQNGSDYFGLDNLLVTGNSDTAIIDGETVIIQNDAGGGSDVGISRLSFTSGNLTLRNDLTLSNTSGNSSTSSGTTLTVESGTLKISDGDFSNAGTISIGAGMKFIFSSGTGDTFTNTGTVDLASNSQSFASLIFNGTYSGGVNNMQYSRFVEGHDSGNGAWT